MMVLHFLHLTLLTILIFVLYCICNNKHTKKTEREKLMFNNSFKKAVKQAEQNTATPAPARQYKPTKKKKNTYIVHLTCMIKPGIHELCSSTPLAVVKLNGVPTENAQKAFMTCTRFPNPGACQMEVLFFQAPE